MKRIAVVLVIPVILTFTACERPREDVRAEADQLISEARQGAILGGAAARQCTELKALIPINGDVQGPTCPDNKAVVNGWSEVCVAQGQCNTAQRRGELNGAAETFCRDWCAVKRCGYRYTPRGACDADFCQPYDFCQQNCNGPLLDTCYFQQSAPNYNCECQVFVEG